MITDSEKRHYFAVKRFSALLRGIISNHHVGDFYYLNCLSSLKGIDVYTKIMIIAMYKCQK